MSRKLSLNLNASGFGDVILDGIPISDLTQMVEVHVDATAGKPVVATLVIPLVELDARLEPDVRYSVHLPFRTPAFVGTGPTIGDALRDLADQIDHEEA